MTVTLVSTDTHVSREFTIEHAENIMRMKEDFGDGLPKGVASVSPVVEPKRKRNSLIEKALNA